MARAVKQNPTLYIGLFVAFFALYAREHQQKMALMGASRIAGEKEAIAPVASVVTQSEKLQELSKVLRDDQLFQVNADGLKADYRIHEIVVSFSGDEVLQEGSFAFRETWYTALDHLAELVKPFLHKGLRIEIIGYTDSGSMIERKPSDYGESDYALSFARAEWVGRFLERRALIPIRERVKLTGGGAVKAGRRVELQFSF